MISIVIPYIRPEKVKRCIKAIEANSGIDDSLYEIITEEDTERIGAPKMVKKMTDACSGDMVCYLGDDTVPYPGFLKYALEAMKNLPDGWGMVGFDDNIRKGGQIKAAAHWLCDKRLLPLLGGEFFHVGYWHCWCDNELAVRTEELGRYTFCKKAYIYHDHVIADIKNDDADYRRVYSQAWLAHDLVLFKQRKRNGWVTP